MNRHLRAALVGLAVTVVMLWLGDLAVQVSVNPPGAARSSFWLGGGIRLLIGAVACCGALAGRRVRIAAALPAVLVAWPLLALGMPVIPLPPSWLPLLGGPPQSPAFSPLVVGVLAVGALLPRRLG